MIKHIVFLRFKKNISEQDVAEKLLALGNLQKAIPEILSFTFGTNISHEGFSCGFTHGFTMEFADETSRDFYVAHPEHKRVVQKFVLPALEDGTNSVVVLDYASG